MHAVFSKEVNGVMFVVAPRLKKIYYIENSTYLLLSFSEVPLGHHFFGVTGMARLNEDDGFEFNKEQRSAIDNRPLLCLASQYLQ